MIGCLLMAVYISVKLKEASDTGWTRCTICTAPYISALAILLYLCVNESFVTVIVSAPSLHMLRMYNGDME